MTHHLITHSGKNSKCTLAAKAGAVLAILLSHGLGAAQQPVSEPMPQPVGASTTFAINGFELTGDVPLSSEESARVLAPFVGPGGTIDTLQKATAALEAALKAKGFALHRVTLPPQEVGKNVTLNIVKFVIGKVSVEGNSAYSVANIRASLPELTEGQAPNFTTLAVQTAIANENPGKQVQVSLKESEEADKIDATVLVKETQAWNLSASLANTGSDATGKNRLSLVGGNSNVFGLDHQLSGAYTTSPDHVRDVKQLGLNYRVPLYRAGGVLGLSYTSSDVVGSFGTFNSTGAGQTLGINYSYYLAPVGGRRTYLSLALDQKRFNVSEISGVPIAGQLDRSSRPLTVGYVAHVESDTAVWGYDTQLSINFPGNTGNDLTAYRSEDTRITSIHWAALRGSVNFLSSFGSGWLWGARGQYQYTDDALISGEQFGLGGASSVRGTGERAIAGDSGLSASFEITSPELSQGLRALEFVDAGWLYNKNSALNANKPPSDRLASAGLGLRYTSGSYGFSADWARVLIGSVLPLTVGSGIPQAGDKKLHVNFTARF